jgi:hypothetical protein
MRIHRACVFAFSVLVPAMYAQLGGGGSIDPPAGARELMQARGEGVQIYACSQTPQGQQWTLKGPEAKLLDKNGTEIGSHFAGPTWKLASGGQVQGELAGSQPSPEAESVAWLLLRAKPGTAEGGLTDVAFIQRTETHGGVADKSGCASAGDLGKVVRIPYTATYRFYTTR